MTIALIWALAAILLTLAAGMGVMIWHIRHRQWRMRLRLRQSLGIAAQRKADIQGVEGLLARLGMYWMRRRGEEQEIVTLLSRVGWHRHQDYAVFLGIRLLLPPATIFLVIIVWLWTGSGLGLSLGLALFAAFVLGWLAPLWGLRLLSRNRQKRIRNEVQMLAQLLKVLFDAGLGVDQSLLTVAKENKDIIPATSVKLQAAMRQVERGAERSEALLNMARAVDVPDLTDLVDMLRQVDRYGGSVREPLREFVELLDDRRRTELQERVGKLSGRMTIVMVVFLFPALLVFLAGPGFIAIWRLLTGLRV
jgi:tight adherence protein C